MRRILLSVFCILALATAFLLIQSKTSAQSSFAQRRITQAIDESKLAVLRGNTHPYARPQADQGAAPDDFPVQHALLVLKPSPEQQAALSKLLADQQDPASPSYHKWLTPAEFGQQFGTSEEDIQTVSSWLESHGFSIDQVPAGRSFIEFSGAHSNVKEAFHTEIHKYLVKGQEHLANASDPQIPAALAPVVVGVNSLHDFYRKPMARRVGSFTRDKVTGKVTPRQPHFTFGTLCGLQNLDCFLVGPGDFTKIYSVPTANTGGQGINIGIVGDSEINLTDAQQFFSIFGILGPGNAPRALPTESIATGGVTPNPTINGDEIEADIDTQWSSAIAPAANVTLVVSGNVGVQQGIDIAAASIVNSTTGGKPTFQIVSVSFGTCEVELGAAGNQLYGGVGGLWSQAASQGTSALVSAGDSGASGCENPANLGNATPPQPGITGLAVSGLSSTPFNTAVGGTDFDQLTNEAQFWNAANGANQVSARGYIQETTWNDSCSNLDFAVPQFGFLSTPQANCNDNNVTPSFIVPQGGGGGVSSCAVFAGAACTGYPKPGFQTGPGVPNDMVRDVPDVSFFSGTGLVGSFYALCQRDQDPENPPNPCSATTDIPNDIQGVGGTSVAVQAFAGIVALIDQAKGGPQGLINGRLYTLAATKSCSSSTQTLVPPANCIFNDVTKGTNAQPCVLNTPECSSANEAILLPSLRNISRATTIFVVLACVSFIGLLFLGYRLKHRNWGSAFALLAFALLMTCAACGGGGGGTVAPTPTNGILADYNAGAGFDEATGLGSVNINALLANF